MINIRICLCCVLALAASSAFSQTGKKRLEKAEKQAEAQRDRSFGGSQTDNERKDDKGDIPKNQMNKLDNGVPRSEQNDPANANDTSRPAKETKESGTIAPNEDQAASGNDNAADSSGNQSTPPAVIQRTTSESGWPAMLTEDGERDGTNNIQRAKLNTAGASVKGNLHLDRNTTSEKNANTESRVRKEEEIPGTGPARSAADKTPFGENANKGAKSGGNNKNQKAGSGSSKSKNRQKG